MRAVAVELLSTVGRRDSRRLHSQFRCHHVARSLNVAASPGACDAFFIIDHHCFIICKLGSCIPSSRTIVYLQTVHQHLEPTHVFSIVTHNLNIPTVLALGKLHHLIMPSFICRTQRRCCGALVGCLSRGTTSVPRSLKMIGRYAYSTIFEFPDPENPTTHVNIVSVSCTELKSVQFWLIFAQIWLP